MQNANASFVTASQSLMVTMLVYFSKLAMMCVVLGWPHFRTQQKPRAMGITFVVDFLTVQLNRTSNLKQVTIASSHSKNNPDRNMGVQILNIGQKIGGDCSFDSLCSQMLEQLLSMDQVKFIIDNHKSIRSYIKGLSNKPSSVSHFDIAEDR
jgi:hypothetical protein